MSSLKGKDRSKEWKYAFRFTCIMTLLYILLALILFTFAEPVDCIVKPEAHNMSYSEYIHHTTLEQVNETTVILRSLRTSNELAHARGVALAETLLSKCNESEIDGELQHYVLSFRERQRKEGPAEGNHRKICDGVAQQSGGCHLLLQIHRLNPESTRQISASLFPLLSFSGNLTSEFTHLISGTEAFSETAAQPPRKQQSRPFLSRRSLELESQFARRCVFALPMPAAGISLHLSHTSMEPLLRPLLYLWSPPPAPSPEVPSSRSFSSRGNVLLVRQAHTLIIQSRMLRSRARQETCWELVQKLTDSLEAGVKDSIPWYIKSNVGKGNMEESVRQWFAWVKEDWSLACDHAPKAEELEQDELKWKKWNDFVTEVLASKSV